MFLVCGHTKNVCDRMFKELKQKFHHKNVYTMGQLMDVLNYSPKVNAVRAPSEMHFDWGTYFDKLYKRPANGTVTKNHIFQAEMSSLGHITTERIKGTDVTVQNLNVLKSTSTGSTKGGRTRTLRHAKPSCITPPGLKPIKQVELYKKWGPVVPEEFRDEICPKPSDRIINQVKSERAQKLKSKQSTKKKSPKTKAPKKKATKKKSPKNKAPKKKN